MPKSTVAEKERKSERELSDHPTPLLTFVPLLPLGRPRPNSLRKRKREREKEAEREEKSLHGEKWAWGGNGGSACLEHSLARPFLVGQASAVSV